MLSEMDLSVDHSFYPILILPYRPKALLDRTVAEIYGVATKQVNQAVSRNPQRFPEDFYFELNRKEFELVTKCDQFPKIKHSSVMPKAFTWEGCNMLATVLKSETAYKRAIQIIRVFTAMEKTGEEPKIHIGDREILKALACELNEVHLEIRELKQLKEQVKAIEKKISEKEILLETGRNCEKGQIENQLSFPLKLSITKAQTKKLQTVVKSKAQSKKQMFQIWQEFKKQFEVSRYVHLPKEKFSEALKWLKKLE